jgi:ribonuclease-3
VISFCWARARKTQADVKDRPFWRTLLRQSLPQFMEDIDSRKSSAFNDYKTVLQEIIQKNPEEKVEYHLAGQSGPDHNKAFKVEVCLNSNVIGTGIGKSKKEAEQMAAKEALELMGHETQ